MPLRRREVIKGLFEVKGTQTRGEMSVVSVGDRYFVASLRAAGVEGRVASTPGEAGDVIEGLVAEGECKVVVVPQALAAGLEKKRDELARRKVYYPVFAVVPDIVPGRGAKSDRLYRLIGMAVGARLRLEKR